MKHILFATALGVLTTAAAQAASTAFFNPVGPATRSSADPFVMRHADGYYYYVHTTDDWASLEIARSPSLSGIGAATPVRVWTAPPGPCSGSNCHTHWVWAPELYYLQGAWYMYFAAGGDDNQHRVWVIRNTSADPTQGTWSAPVKVADSANHWAIDQTLVTAHGQMYMAWSEISDAGLHQHIRIAKMSSPTTLVGRGTVITVPTTYAWEHEKDSDGNDTYVNEGPQFLIHGSRVIMSFSASGCWTDAYKLGTLTADLGADLTVPSSWTKSPAPILQQAPGAYGPGHNGFVKSPDGTEDWVVYHANPASGQGCGNSRTTRIQRITWNGDTPVIGTPVAPGMPVTRPSGEGTGDILYRIRNQVSGKVLSVDRSAAPLGATAWLWTDYGNTDQKWSLETSGNDHVRLRSSYNGYVLDVQNRSTAAGARIITWSANGGPNQDWQLQPTATQHFSIRSRHSGMMLDNKDWNTNDGAPTQQWPANGLAPQLWLFERLE